MTTDGAGGGTGPSSDPLSRAATGATRVAVVHHWDADGIASAAMAIEEVLRASPGAEVINTSPTIGRWYLDDDEVAALADWGPDLLVIVDLAVQHEHLVPILDGLGVPTVMVDHHRAEPVSDPRLVYHNPVAEGGPEEESPSCTWVLMRMTGRPVDLLAALGAFGDRGRGVVSEPVWPQLEAFLSASGMGEADMHALVDLLDSSAKMLDVGAVNAAVQQLLEGWREPRSLLDRPDWRAAVAEVERALEEQLEKGAEERRGKVLLKRIDTTYLVISTAARRLIRTRGEPVVVVVNEGYSEGEAQLYVRRRGGLDMAPLIQVLRGMGLSAGGKSEVVGAVAPKGELEGVLDAVLRFIEGGDAPS